MAKLPMKIEYEVRSVEISPKRQFVEQFVIYNALRQGNEDWSWDDFVKAAIAAWEAIEKEFEK
jgi:hypothetical protein